MHEELKRHLYIFAIEDVVRKKKKQVSNQQAGLISSRVASPEQICLSRSDLSFSLLRLFLIKLDVTTRSGLYNSI